jgi:hypothetical protein
MPHYSREMGCTPTDLIRWLPQALGSLYPRASLIIDGNVLLSAAKPELEIVGITKPARKIALLQIPILELKLCFSENWATKECDEALKRFDLYTRRGGG